ncbi:hypothetical protein V6N13_051063 [Hibiscus sabdariffa]
MEMTWNGCRQSEEGKSLVHNLRALHEWNRNSFGMWIRLMSWRISLIVVILVLASLSGKGSCTLNYGLREFLFFRELKKHFERVPNAGTLLLVPTFFTLTEDQSKMLELEILKSEIKVAIWNCDGSKASGPYFYSD